MNSFRSKFSLRSFGRSIYYSPKFVCTADISKPMTSTSPTATTLTSVSSRTFASVSKLDKWESNLIALKQNENNDTAVNFYEKAWDDDYGQVLAAWGWQAPQECISLLKQYYPNNNNNDSMNIMNIIDIGCGTGAVGDALIQDYDINGSIDIDNVRLYGCDASIVGLNKLRENQLANGTSTYPYVGLAKYNFNEDSKLPCFDSDSDSGNGNGKDGVLFDVAIASGVLSYVEDLNDVMQHCYNGLKVNGIFIFTHRVDHLERGDYHIINKVTGNDGNGNGSDGKLFEKLYESEKVGYLPKNPNYGMDVLVQYFVLRKV